jgi:hypothetical protein
LCSLMLYTKPKALLVPFLVLTAWDGSVSNDFCL